MEIERIEYSTSNNSSESTNSATEVSTTYGSVHDESTKTITISSTEKATETDSKGKTDSEVVSIPIGESASPNEEVEQEKIIGEESAKDIKARHHKLRDLKISKKDYQEAKASLEHKAKELGIDIDKVPLKERHLYMMLAVAYKKGHISEAEFAKVAEEYGCEEVSKAVKENIPEGSQTVDESRMEKIRQRIKHFGKMDAIVGQQIADNQFGATKEETTKLREEALLRSAKRSEKHAEELMKTIKESLPDDCSEEVAKAAIGTAKEYIDSKIDSISSLAKNRGYSDKLISKLNSLKETIRAEILAKEEKMVQAYFERKIKIKEHILERRKEVAAKRQEETIVAKNLYAKALEHTQYLQEKAAKVIRWFNLDKLNTENKEKAIRMKDPRLAIDIDYAVMHKKWALEAQDTAIFKEKQANTAVDFMEVSLAYTKAAMEISMNRFS